MIELIGMITMKSGMWSYKIYQRGSTFYFEEQSEMMEEPSTYIYKDLRDALLMLWKQT